MLRRPILPVFNTYFASDSLLFQFVLHEFLRTLGEVYKLECVVSDEDTPEAIHGKLTDYLLKLAGTEQEYVRIFTWIYDAGVLTKLKNSVDLLSQKAPVEDSEMRSLHLVVQKAWLECLHSIDLYRNQELKALKPQVLKAMKLIRKIPAALKKLLARYDDDENVIYYLIRHKNQFDHIIGPDFLKDMLNKNSVPFLIERYRMRGFDKLVPEIEALSNVINH